MRSRACLVVALSTGCQFQHGNPASQDAPDVRDALPDTLEIDAGSPRVTSGLIGFWTFDDPPGSRMLADTSGTTAPVPLEIITSSTIAAPVVADGMLTAEIPGRVASKPSTHLSADCQIAGGVTLEAWIRPSAPIQGTASQQKFVVGLAANITSRNVAILQAGGTWVGRVRTTPAADGTPSLESTSMASTTGMTHVVIAADATTRVMYVNDVAEAVGAPGAPMGWDLTYPMVAIDEYQHARQWTGSIALVALYSRALTAPEVHQNFVAGPQ
ncbi:MAG: LamG domain-containing protein [Kofleriaceae bacterium]|nr:LamG domain-containing protein [Kofleriaceae bacterium]